ncbi:Cytochrome c biogenesis ATP-binding export protein CcmA [Rhizobiaceae bacterium]|nr:Cytochrome c biogenesis ATP-binding export protein CcmA [Rhizobiaceae bacterium]
MLRCNEAAIRLSMWGAMQLAVVDLAGERGGEPIFTGISFLLVAHGSIVVTGPNGAGKSTLLRVLAGLLPTAGGSIAWEGGGEEWPTLAGSTHYLGHSNAMKPALTVAENLGFWRDFHGSHRASVVEALDKVGLSGIGHLPFGYLSTGQKRRASIARLLVSRRPLWLLDEPTSGLDRASEARFAALMEEHLASGGMIVAATHLPLGLSGAKTLEMSGRRSHGSHREDFDALASAAGGF